MEISISVIVPVYNTIRYLERCIESILRQTLQDFELILIDDGSDDGSGELCDSYKAVYDNVKVIHKENEGQGYARNKGIEISAGKYVVFVDADDYLDSDFLAHLYEAIDRNNADCAVAGYTVIYSDNKMRRQPCVKKEKLFVEEEVRKLLLESFGALPCSRRDVPYGQAIWARIYSRQLLEEHSVRFVSEREYIGEDLVFNLDFLRYAKRAVAIPDTSYHYNCANQGSFSKMHRSDRAKMDILLKQYMEKKLDTIFENREYRLYLQRSLIIRVGYDIVQEVLYHDHKDRTYPMRESIRKILANEELRKVLCVYPWWKLPFQRMVLTGIMRFQLADLLIWLIRTKQCFGHSTQNI